MPASNRSERVACSVCGTNITNLHMKQHMVRFHGPDAKSCSQCKFLAKSNKELEEHVTKKHSKQSKLQCTICGEVFKSYYSLMRHKKLDHGSNVQNKTADINLEEEFGTNEELLEELRPVKHFLVDNVMYGKAHNVFNFKMQTLDHSQIKKNLSNVYEQLDCAAKVNIGFGFILTNLDGEFRYYYAHSNNMVFDVPIVMANKQDLEFITDRMDDEDFIEHIVRERPDTK